jgi:hypothetical protein
MKTAQPCIFVFNPFSGQGHLDSWNAMFIATLLDSGYRVLALTPDSHALKERLNEYAGLSTENLQLLNWAVLKRKFLSRVIGRFRRLVNWPVQTKNSGAESTYIEPLDFARRVKVACQKAIHKPDFVLNMYMDLYKTDVASWKSTENLLSVPWAGIRFVPRDRPSEAYYANRSLVGMCLLDETLCEQYQATMPTKLFKYLPDITDSSLPIGKSSIVSKIQAKAAGRHIVFMGGAIGRTKNLANWYELISRADLNKWYFVQIGKINHADLTFEDQEALRAILNHPLKNLYIRDEYLADEKIFNQVIATADIIFAVYKDFTISSNMLGKAAAFNKPIIVAEGKLMAHRVERYKIGCAVPENDTSKMLVALETMIKEAPNLHSGFESYRRDFSIEKLKTQLLALIAQYFERSHNCSTSS